MFTFTSQAQDQQIRNKNEMVNAMSNFPADSSVRALVDSSFKTLSQNRRKVITMFDKLFTARGLTNEDIRKVHQKAIAIIVNGDEALVGLYIQNNPITTNQDDR